MIPLIAGVTVNTPTHRLMTFPWLLPIIALRHTLCPFILYPSLCLNPYQLRERETLKVEERKAVGVTCNWVAPPLFAGHWEWVNTKPPLLTSTLKQTDADRQGASLTAFSISTPKVSERTEILSFRRVLMCITHLLHLLGLLVDTGAPQIGTQVQTESSAYFLHEDLFSTVRKECLPFFASDVFLWEVKYLYLNQQGRLENDKESSILHLFITRW